MNPTSVITDWIWHVDPRSIGIRPKCSVRIQTGLLRFQEMVVTKKEMRRCHAPKSNDASNDTSPPSASSNTSELALVKRDCVTPGADACVSATPQGSLTDDDQDGSSQPNSRNEIETRERAAPSSLDNNHIARILNRNTHFCRVLPSSDVSIKRGIERNR